MRRAGFPLLYEIPTRYWLSERVEAVGLRAGLLFGGLGACGLCGGVSLEGGNRLADGGKQLIAAAVGRERTGIGSAEAFDAEEHF